jgi:hypothetical protein
VLEVEIKSHAEDVGARMELIDLYLEGGHPAGALPHLAALRRLVGAGDPRVAAIAARVERALAPSSR